MLQKTLGLSFTRAEIRRAIGILRTNSVRLDPRTGHMDGVAVYPTYSFANHSCLCNTHTRKHRDHRLELVAQTAIPAGEQVVACKVTSCSQPNCLDLCRFGLGTPRRRSEASNVWQTFRKPGTSPASAPAARYNATITYSLLGYSTIQYV